MAWQAVVAALPAIVGAGFVSGREVWVFFAGYGAQGEVLAGAAALLIGAGAWRLAGGRDIAHATGCWRVALGLFSLVTLAAVLAALGSLGQLRLGLPPWIVEAAAALLVALGSSRGTAMLRRGQGLLLVLVIGLVALTAVVSLGHSGSPATAKPLPLAALVGSVGYAAFNLALAGDGIARSTAGLGAPGQRGALIGGLAAGLLLTLEAMALARFGGALGSVDLPLRQLAQAHGAGLAAAVDLAVALSAVSAAASFLQAAAEVFGGPWTVAGIAFATSTLGVQPIVDQGYPLMAAVASIWLVATLRGERPK